MIDYAYASVTVDKSRGGARAAARVRARGVAGVKAGERVADEDRGRKAAEDVSLISQRVSHATSEVIGGGQRAVRLISGVREIARTRRKENTSRRAGRTRVVVSSSSSRITRALSRASAIPRDPFNRVNRIRFDRRFACSLSYRPLATLAGASRS